MDGNGWHDEKRTRRIILLNILIQDSYSCVVNWPDISIKTCIHRTRKWASMPFLYRPISLGLKPDVPK